MAKGSYTVGETSTKDSSFRSCLCALLIFLALCVIILLVSIIKLTHDGKDNDSKGSMEHLELHGSELTSPKLNEKMIVETTTSTETKTKIPTTSIPNITTKGTVLNFSTAVPITTKRPTMSTFDTTTTVSSTTKTIPETTVLAITEGKRKVQTNIMNPLTTTRYSTVIDETANLSSTTTTKMYNTTSFTTSSPVTLIPFETNKTASLTETTAKTFTTTKTSNNTMDKSKTTTLGTSVDVTTTRFPINYTTTQKVQDSVTDHLELQESERTPSKMSEKMILKTTTSTETTIPFSTTINKAVLNISPTVPTTTKLPSNAILNTTIVSSTQTEATAFASTVGERESNTINPLPMTVTDVVTNSTTAKIYKTTSSATSPRSSSMPIHIPFETNKNATSRAETTTEASTTTNAPNDSMDVVETGAFDITDEPETSLTTTDTAFPIFPTSPSSTLMPIDIRFEKKENETFAGTTTTTQKIQEVRIPTTTKAPEEPVCLTPGCKSVASRILSLMNHSIDPCEDFYEFACGGMQVDNDNSQSWKAILEQTYLINDESPKYLQTFRTFYDSCVSHEYIFDYNNRTAKVREAVNAVGTITDGNNESENIDITETFAKLVLRRSSYVMDVDLDVDKESSKFILKLSLPSFLSVFSETNGNAVPLTDLKKRCLDKTKSQFTASFVDLNQVHDEFLNCQKDFGVILNSVETSVSALGFYSHLTDTFNKTQAMQDLRTTIEWDLLDHVNVLPPPNEIRDTVVLKQYTLHKISDLQMNYPFLNWLKFFKILTDVEFDNSTLVQVYFPEYFQQLFQTLMVPPKWKINNALVALYASHLYDKLVVPNSRYNREEYCMQLSMKLFKDTSSNLYMKTWSKSNLEGVQKFLTNIFDTVKRSFSEELNVAEWVDDFSKDSMLRKVDNMTLTFNKMEDSYNNDEHLNKKYDKLILAKKDFIDNVLKVIEFERKALFRNTGEMYSIDKLWSYFVNIFDNYPTSFYALRLIMAPLGMMKEPVRGYPGYITMSRIGLLLAREIGRHFNPVGIQYGMMLTPTSKYSYDEMVTTIKNNDLLKKSNKKFKNQVVSFAVPPDVSVNERISDNTGMNLITNYLSTLKAENILPWISSTFSKEKIFFISIAQDYCQVTDMIDYMLALYESEILPPSLRVENIVTNSEAFASTFSCPEGSYMNNNPWKTQFPNLIQYTPT